MKTPIPKKLKPALAKYGSLVLILWAIYFFISINADNSRALEKYNLSESGLNWLQLLVSLPIAAVWLIILFAALSFYGYAQTIHGSKEGKAFRYISGGLTVLLIGMIAGAYLSLLERGISGETYSGASSENKIIVFENYAAAITSLLAYWFFWKAGRVLLGLINSAKQKAKIFQNSVVILLPAALIYLYLLLNNPYRSSSDNQDVFPTYALPDIWIILTIFLPYMLAWGLGIYALLSIIIFQTKVKGIIYKNILKHFTGGMTLIISLNITLQFLTQFNDFFSRAGLGLILVIIAVIYTILVYGYVLVAYGALKLNSIEAVNKAESD